MKYVKYDKNILLNESYFLIIVLNAFSNLVSCLSLRRSWRSKRRSYVLIIFLNWYSGGVESNWVHSALRPPIGLLCQPRVIMMLYKLVEWWLAVEPKCSEKTCPSAALSTTNPTCSARTRTLAAAVGSQLLTAWATTRPTYFRYLVWGIWPGAWFAQTL
jgi:hypothetical protein